MIKKGKFWWADKMEKSLKKNAQNSKNPCEHANMD